MKMATVTINQGILRGRKAESANGKAYFEFLGVPYAKPPVGDLRFKSPQEPDSWDGERNATIITEYNICCQLDYAKGSIAGSEDCLYLNVYTPSLPDSDSKLLPVMVFVHGGGFHFTNGILKKDMGPDYLIDHDVVVVTFNYRLGILGFLSLDIPEAAGNMGLKDQVLALKWVQNNIEHFSGDPNNVTIFGIGAGSASVDYLLLSPLAKGLFHKAILQSGSSLNHWAINYEPKQLIVEVLEKMKYNGSFDNNQEIYEYLHSSPLSHLVESSYKVKTNYDCNRNYFGFVPTVEKDFGNGDAFITSNPYKLFLEGKFHQVPVIKSFCNKEGYLMCFLKLKDALDLAQNKNFVDYLSYPIDANDKSRFNETFLALYTENVQANDVDSKMIVDFFGDLDFVSGAWISGQMMASKVPVYFYEFGYEGKINFLQKYFGKTLKGAAHGDDFTYIFNHNTVSKSCESRDSEVRATMTKLFTNFAKTSNPTPDNELSFQWPEYKDNSAYLHIEETFNIKTNYEPKKMEVFKELYDKYHKI